MRVLIVDDDSGLRQSLALLLQESGYEVVGEGDPEQALQRAGTEAFELILCDVRMPKMDGVSFLQRYRADGGSALLIMMSAYGTEDSALAAMREGAYDYLHKPFQPDEVLMTLRLRNSDVPQTSWSRELTRPTCPRALRQSLLLRRSLFHRQP